MKVHLPNGSSYYRDVFREDIPLSLEHFFDANYVFLAYHGELQTENSEWLTDSKTSAVIPVLTDEEEQLLTYHATCRNEVRRSYKIEEFSIEINSTPLDELFAFHKTCEELRGWIPVPPEELTASRIIAVRFKDELIAGMSAYGSRDILRIGRIFSLRKSTKYQDLQQIIFSSASRRVVHEFTRLANREGFTRIDLGGVVIDGESEKSGITKFKMSFGSEVQPVTLLRRKGEGFDSLEAYFKTHQLDLT